ncbi:MAG TPA: hypothetical protein VM124_00740 [Candidatus Limnocylindrales bacterium]|nr:hypothetical protein [Candidatus Limnocylindrales bacterium]
MSNIRLQDSVQNAVDKFINYIPQLVGALLILLLGHIIARVLQGVVTRVLDKIRFERALAISPAGRYVARFVEKPGSFIGRIVYWIVFLLFISAAVSTLNIPALNILVAGFYSYIPKILAAALIFLVASAITAGAEKFIKQVLGEGPMAGLISAILPAITMSIAVFMILNQLQIAKDIVNITYTAIMGSLALGLALAFGLGGRDVAGRILSQAYDAAQTKQLRSPRSKPKL